MLLTFVYRSLGREDDRRKAAELGLERAQREQDRNPENSSPTQLGAIALAHLGERERACEWSARVLAIDPDGVLAQYNVACCYAQIGDLEAAMELLEKVLLRTSPDHLRWVENDSDLTRSGASPGTRH